VGGDALPELATNVLDDFEDNVVHDNLNNHVLYHRVQDVLYRQEDLQNMQNVSISLSGALVATGVTAAALEIYEGDDDTIVAIYDPHNATAVNTDFAYVSGDEDIATVDTDGVVTAVAYGETVITATHNDTGVTVDVDITATLYTGAAISIAVEDTTPIVIKFQPSNVTQPNADFTYVSSLEAKATIAAVTGVITAIEAGATVITATHTASSKEIEVTVTVTA
jgi:uncharacterized protein YjdB